MAHCLLFTVASQDRLKEEISENLQEFFLCMETRSQEQIFEKYGQVGLKKEISENCAWKPILAIQKLNIYKILRRISAFSTANKK